MNGRSSLWIAPLLGIALLSASCGGGDSSASNEGGTGVCTMLTGYMPSTSTPLHLTDLLPILQDPAGCGTGGACHGMSPIFLDKAGTKTMSFASMTDGGAGDLAAILQTLTSTSVNAPSMKRVVPGNVGASFLAYKISGADGLACIKSMCASASVGLTTPCGDPMPLAGYTMLTAANKTKILDWIAQGAAQ